MDANVGRVLNPSAAAKRPLLAGDGLRTRATLAITVCSALFIVVLGVSAYWDPTIRELHLFEALPYVVAAVLCLRRNRFGYALGFVSGAFWLSMSGWRTTFVRNGFELLAAGNFDRPDILIAVPAAIATGGLALFSMVGYLQQPAKRPRDIFLFVAALVIVPLFFIAIFAAFAPRFLGIFGFH